MLKINRNINGSVQKPKRYWKEMATKWMDKDQWRNINNV